MNALAGLPAPVTPHQHRAARILALAERHEAFLSAASAEGAGLEEWQLAFNSRARLLHAWRRAYALNPRRDAEDAATIKAFAISSFNHLMQVYLRIRSAMTGEAPEAIAARIERAIVLRQGGSIQ